MTSHLSRGSARVAYFVTGVIELKVQDFCVLAVLSLGSASREESVTGVPRSLVFHLRIAPYIRIAPPIRYLSGIGGAILN